jgi:hypothetical protein
MPDDLAALVVLVVLPVGRCDTLDEEGFAETAADGRFNAGGAAGNGCSAGLTDEVLARNFL